MSVQIFSLRNVLEDEAEDIRQLLTEHQLEFYETPPGNWGISIPALWLKHDEDEARARALIHDYQQARSERVRAEYAEQQEAGDAPGFMDNLREHPFRMLFYLAVMGVILYISIKPFMIIE